MICLTNGTAVPLGSALQKLRGGLDFKVFLHIGAVCLHCICFKMNEGNGGNTESEDSELNLAASGFATLNYRS